MIANLLFNMTPTQTFRVNYTLDYGHHRQTGEAGYLDQYGQPITLFPVHNPLYDAQNGIIEKRDRLSLAILNQVSGEYRGKFLDNRLTITAGVRAPFFQRKLHNYCFTTAANGNVDCTDELDAENASYAAAHPTYAPPQKRNVRFNKVLPAAGLTFDVTPLVSVYGSYSRGLQVPGTDSLYNSFFPGSPTPKSETSDNFDGGVRARSGKLQAQFAGWYTIFQNRIEQSFDVATQLTTYTNLGTVHKYGFDGSISYKINKYLNLYGFGSRLYSKILNNVQTGVAPATGAAVLNPYSFGGATPGAPIFAATQGKFESAASKYTFGGRAEVNVGPAEVGVQVKRNGPRYVNDQNTPIYQSYVVGGVTTFYQIYGAKAPAYTTVDLDARISLKPLTHNNSTYLQLNVVNVFDKLYVGGFGSSSATVSNTSIPNVQIGAPRTISGTVVIGF